MNSREIGIYVALTHPAAPESYRIVDEGTKLYTLVDGVLVSFDGEKLDEMSATDLYLWAQREIVKWRADQYW